MYKKTFLALALLSMMLISNFGAAIAGGRPLSAELLGTNEVSGGDPDGSGMASLTLNSGQEEICFDITVSNIDAPTAAHIHMETAGNNGGVVVNFDIANNGLSGCVDVARSLVKEIRKNPAGYYVNVHNLEHRSGAVRGQLSK